MITFISEYGLFLAKVVTVVLALLVLIAAIAAASGRERKGGKKGHVKAEHLNDFYKNMGHELQSDILTADEWKQLEKDEKKKLKAEKKLLKQGGPRKKRVFVLAFYGDVGASEVELLRHEISAVLHLAEKQDEIVIRLESPGGMVHSYGLASSQLARIRNSGISLTVCVDKVAASGGYMMACLADKIVAAPFAIVGSIGVLAQVPNFNRLLKKHDVDYELYTAGEFKRTVTMLGENTEKGRQKFKEEIEDTHGLFKEFVVGNRPQLNIEKVATGEHWYGLRALDLKLVDVLMTSDEYLIHACQEADVYAVTYEQKKNIMNRLGLSMEESLDKLLLRWFERLSFKRF